MEICIHRSLCYNDIQCIMYKGWYRFLPQGKTVKIMLVVATIGLLITYHVRDNPNVSVGNINLYLAADIISLTRFSIESWRSPSKNIVAHSWRRRIISRWNVSIFSGRPIIFFWVFCPCFSVRSDFFFSTLSRGYALHWHSFSVPIIRWSIGCSAGVHVPWQFLSFFRGSFPSGKSEKLAPWLPKFPRQHTERSAASSTSKLSQFCTCNLIFSSPPPPPVCCVHMTTT